MAEYEKSTRAHFARLLKENKVSSEDMETYRTIGKLVLDAKVRADKDCPGAADKCYPGEDCGYDDGGNGCGNDECCNWCDSCMVLYDTCSMACGEKMD